MSVEVVAMRVEVVAMRVELSGGGPTAMCTVTPPPSVVAICM